MLASRLFCLLALIGLGAAPAPAAAEGRDAHGDPLPAGAVARLGGARLVHPGMVIGAAFVDGGDALLVAFLSDAALTGAGGEAPFMRLWATQDGALLREISGPVAPSSLSPASADGRTVIALDPLGRPQPFDAQRRALGPPVALQGISGLTAVAPTADGAAVLATDGRQVGLWSWPEGALIRTYDVREPPGVLAVSASGRGAVAVGPRGDVALLQLDQAAPTAVLPGDGQRVTALSVSPSGDAVAIVDEALPGGRLRVHRFEGPRRFDPIPGGGAVFSPDGARLITGLGAPAARSAQDGALIHPILPRAGGVIRVLAQAPDGTLALLIDQRRIVLVDQAGALRHPDLLRGVSLSGRGGGALIPGGGAVTWGPTSGVAVWSPAGALLRHAHDDLDLLGAAPFVGSPGRRAKAIPQVALHHRGPEGGQISVAPLADLALQRHHAVRTEAPSFIQPTRDGRRLIHTAPGQKEPLWRLDTWTGAIGRLSTDEGRWRGVCHGPDGQIAALVQSPAPGWRKTPSASVYLWPNHRAKGRRIIVEVAGRLGGGRSPLLIACGFSEDGKLLTAAGPNGVYFIHTRRAMRLRRQIELEADDVVTVAVSPDASVAAFARLSGEIVVRALPSGEILTRLSGHEGLVHHLDLSVKGRLLSMGADGAALIWQIPKNTMK